MTRPLLATILAFCVSVPSAAARLPRVGLLPFDAVNVSTSVGDSAALAKLVRIEMIKGHAVTPVLLPMPAGAAPPLPPEVAAAAGKTAGVDLVLVGTVVDADVTHSSHGANTGGLLGGIGAGARVDRATARVSLHIDLVDPGTGQVVDSFDVDGKNSETGIGMDLSTVLGSIDQGTTVWERSPVGKALSQAAQKIDREVARRAPKLVRGR